MGDVYTNPPQSRNEAILRATIDGTEYTAPPQSRIEDLLLELKEAIEQSGGTGEGDMKKSVYDSDSSIASAGGIKMFVNQKIGTLPQRVGSLETTAGVLEGEVASIEDTLDNLGTASTKNSTSVVTQSTDLVESGAVKDIVGWGNKNKLNKEDIYSKHSNLSVTQLATGINITANSGATWASVVYKLNIKPNTDYIVSSDVDLTDGIVFFQLKHGTTTVKTGTAITESGQLTLDFNLAYNDEVYLHIFVSNATAYLTNADLNNFQLEKGSTATTYEPYHASVEDTLRDAEVVEGKNLLNITMAKLKVNNSAYTWSGDVLSHNGASISFIESNGFVTGIAISGTVTSAFNVRLTDTGNIGYQGKILNGTFDANKEYVYVYDEVASQAVDDVGNGVTIPDTFTRYRIVLNVKAGTHNNEVIYPMISKDGGKYEPYYVPLKDVVPKKADNSVIGTVEDGATASQDYAVGDYFIKDTILGKTKATISSGGTFTKDTNYEETNVAKELTELYKYIGILTTPVEAFTANSLPILKRNITNAFYNGSLRGEIAAGNFKNVRPGDYIIGQATGSTYYVAECDYWLGNGDSTNGTTYPAYNTHHLGLMLFKPVGTTALWRGYGYSDKSWRVSAADLGRCPWNADTTVDPTDIEAIGSNSTNITRSYNGTNMSAYMGSFIRERIDAILLPQCFQADFGSENVLKRRNWLSNAINASAASGGRSDWQGISSGSVWVDRFIDLASEVELYGSRINSSSRDDIGVQNKQLPIYRNGRIHDFYPRIDLWTKGVASATVAAYRNVYGYATAYGGSVALWACPLGCVK